MVGQYGEICCADALLWGKKAFKSTGLSVQHLNYSTYSHTLKCITVLPLYVTGPPLCLLGNFIGAADSCRVKIFH